MPFAPRSLVAIIATLALLTGGVGATAARYADIEVGAISIDLGDWTPPVPADCLNQWGFLGATAAQQLKQAVDRGSIVVQVGTDGNDTLAGSSSKSDLIFGMGGNDTLSGDAQDDCIMGGRGNDFIRSGNGADIVWGGSGDDVIYGGSGGNSNAGGDVLRGDDGAMNATGPSSPTCLDASCNDTIHGGPHPTLDPGGGDNENLMYGGPGNDEMRGAGSTDVMHGEASNDNMFGDNGDDEMYGGAGDDLMSGDAGTDILDGGDGLDIIWNDSRLGIPNPSGIMAAAQENVTPIGDAAEAASAEAEPPAGEASAGETPAEEAPAAETPAEDTPAEETPPPDAAPEPVEQPGETPSTDVGEEPAAEVEEPATDVAPEASTDTPAPSQQPSKTTNSTQPQKAAPKTLAPKVKNLPGGDGDRDVIRGGGGKDTCIAETLDSVNGCEKVAPAGLTVVAPVAQAEGAAGGGATPSRSAPGAAAVLRSGTPVRGGRHRRAPGRTSSRAAAAGPAEDIDTQHNEGATQ